MELVLIFVVVVVAIGAALWFSSARVVRQIERGVVFRLGRAQERVRPPGLTMLVPFVDRMTKVNVQVVTLPVPAQDGITRDNVTVKVDAVVYFRVIDPWRAAVVVQDYRFAILQVAQTSLRSIIGKSEMDDLLSNREKLNEGLAIMLDSPAMEPTDRSMPPVRMTKVMPTTATSRNELSTNRLRNTCPVPK